MAACPLAQYATPYRHDPLLIPLNHTLSTGNPSINDSEITTREATQSLTTVPVIETWGQDISATQYLSGKQLGHVAPRPDVQYSHCFAADIQREAALHSPMERLPAEILAYIFELSLVNTSEAKHVLIPEQGPFHLAHVCKLWRSVAESDPHLWTSIHIHFQDARQSCERDVERVKTVLELHLKRSGTLPISLSFSDRRRYHAATVELVALLVDRLRGHSRRWKHISLHLSCNYFPLLFTFTPCDLSSLEHLSISGDVLGTRTATTLRLNLECAKNLKSFAYSGPGHAVNDKIDLGWERLTDVSFEFAPHCGASSTLSRHLRRLAQCRNITVCSLGIDRPFWSDFDDDQTITLPCLRTLRIRRLSPRSHARSVIDPLVLPRLQTLEIDAASLVNWDVPRSSWHDYNFSSLLRRSGCALRRLSIQDVDFPNDELVHCLVLSRTLTSLRFAPYPPSQDVTAVIHALDPSCPPVNPAIIQESWCRTTARAQGYRKNGQTHVTNDPLVPELREIALASSVEGYLDLMIEMCRSRGGARACAAEVAPLRRVEAVLISIPHVSVGALPGDQSVRRAGLQSEMERWASEIENDRGAEEQLDASVVVQ